MPARLFALLAAFALSAAGFAQTPAKPADPKKDDAKKEEPKVVKGQLPQNWKMLGLTDKQVQEIYKLQGKYNDEIDTLEAKIKELKEKMSKERLEVLTAEQKKRLEEILKDKAGTGDKSKDK
jgi:Spy/CpxP family protein refolding chaperone